MTDTVIYANFGETANTAPSPWTDNYFNSGEGSLGTLKADLLDENSASTGIGLDVTAVFAGTSGDANRATSDNVWPQQVFDFTWHTGGTSSLQFTDIADGSTYSLDLAGHTEEAARDADFTVNGTTLRYDSAGAPTPNAPINFSGTVSGTTLDIDVTLVSGLAYLNGFKLTLTPPVPAGAIPSASSFALF